LISIETDAALGFFVISGVHWASPGWLNTSSVNVFPSVSAFASAVDPLLVPRTLRLTEAVFKFVSGLAEALIRIVVIVVPRRAKGANSSDSDVWGFADALFGGLTQVFVGTLTSGSSASSGELVIGFFR